MTIVDETTQRGPVVVDLGAQKEKYIKELRRGEGKLMRQVEITIDELALSKTIPQDAQVVVVVVREKRKRVRAVPVFPFPLLPLMRDADD